MSSSLISANHNIEEDDQIDQYSRQYVETVETCDKEKEIGK